MKQFLIIIMLITVLQPMPLQACDMESDQAMPHHAGMQESAEHDCCDSGPDELTHACADAVQCGSCSIGISLIASVSVTPTTNLPDQFRPFNDHRRFTSSTHPPFRPPIS